MFRSRVHTYYSYHRVNTAIKRPFRAALRNMGFFNFQTSCDPLSSGHRARSPIATKSFPVSDTHIARRIIAIAGFHIYTIFGFFFLSPSFDRGKTANVIAPRIRAAYVLDSRGSCAPGRFARAKFNGGAVDAAEYLGRTERIKTPCGPPLLLMAFACIHICTYTSMYVRLWLLCRYWRS